MPSGGKLVFQYTRKRPSPRICGATGVRLNGVRPLLLYGGKVKPYLLIQGVTPGVLSHFVDMRGVNNGKHYCDSIAMQEWQ